MVIHDTKCPYLDQTSLNSTKLYQTPAGRCVTSAFSIWDFYVAMRSILLYEHIAHEELLSCLQETIKLFSSGESDRALVRTYLF